MSANQNQNQNQSNNLKNQSDTPSSEPVSDSSWEETKAMFDSPPEGEPLTPEQLWIESEEEE